MSKTMIRRIDGETVEVSFRIPSKVKIITDDDMVINATITGFDFTNKTMELEIEFPVEEKEGEKMRYRVKKTEEKWPFREIHDYGELSIEEIEKMGMKLIDDVFEDASEVRSDMEYIKETGSENWGCNGYCIDIMLVK